MNGLQEFLLSAHSGPEQAWTLFTYVWYVVLPFLLYPLFKVLWMDYAQSAYLSTVRYAMLEIFPPQNLEKSPKLMESIYVALAGSISSFNPLEEFVDGKVLLKFSFELVGESGRVRMLVRTPEAFRNLVESHFYAQYPDVEIRQVSDYVDDVPGVIPNKEWDLWGTDFVLTGPEPLPIKTYDYFEEDVTGKMIDPIAGLFEALGKVGPDQKAWFQLVIVPISEGWNKEKETQDFVEEFAGNKKKETKKGILEELFAHSADVGTHIMSAFSQKPEWSVKKEESKETDPLDLRLTPGKRKALEALESNIGKNVFSVKMRFVYLGRREFFTKAVVSSFIGGIKQFSDTNYLNSFKPDKGSQVFADYYLRKMRLRYRQRKIFRRYKKRDREGKKVILSTKELASLYHIPDMAVQTPYLQRVEAKKGGAPSNLPV